MGESVPTGSSVIVCTTQGEDCPNGGIRVYFGTVIVQITRVGEVFILRDVLGDHRATGRTISVSQEGTHWTELKNAERVTRSATLPNAHVTFFRIEELGEIAQCSVEAPTGAHSAGFTVSCNK
jgi:hypothetical protein